MLHLEFAVAPTQITSINDLALLEARLGFDKGAVLSRFPKAWFREVSEHLNGALDGRNLDKATEKLRQLQESKLVAFERNYEGDGWANAARNSHRVMSFHRMVDAAFNELPIFLSSLEDLGDEDFDFRTGYPRDAHSLASAAKALLNGAEKVTLYDPFICTRKRGYKKTLIELMQLCNKAEVDFHIFSEEDGKPAWNMRLEALERLREEMPDNIKLNWYCADDNGSSFLHPRGLFTAKGGLVYDRGFEEPNDREQREELTDITPMARNMLVQKSRSYSTSLQYDDFELVRDVWRSHP